MSQNTNDLRTAGFYIIGLVMLAGALVFVGPQLAERALASGASNLTSSDVQPERTPTRLSVAVDTAREIRAALSKTQPKLDPLPPITAKLAYGHLKPGSRGSQQRIALPREAMDAMASAAPTVDSRRSYSMPTPVAVEMHRVY